MLLRRYVATAGTGGGAGRSLRRGSRLWQQTPSSQKALPSSSSSSLLAAPVLSRRSVGWQEVACCRCGRRSYTTHPDASGGAATPRDAPGTEALLQESRELLQRGDLAQAARLASRLVPAPRQDQDESLLLSDEASCTALAEIFSRSARLDKALSLLNVLTARGMLLYPSFP